MIRLGIVDFDTSHVVAFTQRLNHVGVKEDQWVDGAKVVIGCPGTSLISPERIPGFTQQLKDYGVELVDKPEEMIGKIDAVLVESVDGSVHFERAKPFLEKGVPTYVDKPFTCSTQEAKALVALAAHNRVPIFSASSLRYAEEVQEFKARQDVGGVVGAEVYSPASLHPRNPGLYHYGIHGVEMLYTLMGAGCEAVWCVEDAGTTLVTGTWKGGRIGVMRGIRKGRADYGFTAFCEKGVVQQTVSAGTIYRELLKRIVAMFQTGKPPIDPSETVEIIAFIEAAIESGKNGGKKVALPL